MMTAQECSQYPLWRWSLLLLHLSYLFPVMTTQQECSQCPLVEMESTTSLPILFISSYNSTTGTFTVSPGGDGVYYFSVYLTVEPAEWARFDIHFNEDFICSTYPNHSNLESGYVPGSCSPVVNAVAGRGPFSPSVSVNVATKLR